MKTRQYLLDTLLGFKADIWGYNTEDYLYWEDYFVTLSKDDLLAEYNDYFGE